ncbi:hypothetical protein Emin_1239 [Elusimicrobium minutum Pei191]|uniref:Uncharacterized protein n=1 Tax=Elusimicrobium minutum (strain Pei191) TaxID=445932 RepID=B2KE43_ELUMP|nr:hypothetical protein [Elusimicrobium minutum]ACC98789.1 hypothetical protein Emin_1239 [Elusimicrobium minutum Pei191]
MTDELDLEPKLESNTKKSKDFWLFLIFVDIIALVFFGFMIYQSLSEKFNTPAQAKEAVQIKDTVVSEQPKPEDKKAPQETTPKPQPKEEPAPAPGAVPVEQPPVSPLPSVVQAAMPELEKKQSVIVEPTKGKTRKVTFKYFGDAKSVKIVSGFTMTKPQDLKKIGGVWQGSFIIYPGEYKYLFIVDGTQTLDPHAPEKDGRSFIKID